MKMDEELCEQWISNDLLTAALVARNEAELVRYISVCVVRGYGWCVCVLAGQGGDM